MKHVSPKEDERKAKKKRRHERPLTTECAESARPSQAHASLKYLSPNQVFSIFHSVASLVTLSAAEKIKQNKGHLSCLWGHV